MPGIDYRELRQRVPMAQVLNLIGFEATWRRGPQLRGLCPIPGCRSASRPTFSVHLTRHVYRRFACHSHGNALDLWAAVRCLSLHPAAIALCQVANVTLPELRPHCQPRRVLLRDS